MINHLPHLALANLFCLAATMSLSAHEGGHHDHKIRRVALNQSTEDSTDNTGNVDERSSMPAIGEHFVPFEKLLHLRWDKDFLYVGSNGLPEHPMMVGIRSWQQQVPIPQKYLGDNAWQIPLHPVPAKQPMSTKSNFCVVQSRWPSTECPSLIH